MQKLNEIYRYSPAQRQFMDKKPIVYNDIDDNYVFYTPKGRLVQSETYDEAHAKWLLTKETD